MADYYNDQQEVDSMGVLNQPAGSGMDAISVNNSDLNNNIGGLRTAISGLSHQVTQLAKSTVEMGKELSQAVTKDFYIEKQGGLMRAGAAMAGPVGAIAAKVLTESGIADRIGGAVSDGMSKGVGFLGNKIRGLFGREKYDSQSGMLSPMTMSKISGKNTHEVVAEVHNNVATPLLEANKIYKEQLKEAKRGNKEIVQSIADLGDNIAGVQNKRTGAKSAQQKHEEAVRSSSRRSDYGGTHGHTNVTVKQVSSGSSSSSSGGSSGGSNAEVVEAIHSLGSKMDQYNDPSAEKGGGLLKTVGGLAFELSGLASLFRGRYASDITKSKNPLITISDAGIQIYRWTRLYGELQKKQLNEIIKKLGGQQKEVVGKRGWLWESGAAKQWADELSEKGGFFNKAGALALKAGNFFNFDSEEFLDERLAKAERGRMKNAQRKHKLDGVKDFFGTINTDMTDKVRDEEIGRLGNKKKHGYDENGTRTFAKGGWITRPIIMDDGIRAKKTAMFKDGGYVPPAVAGEAGKEGIVPIAKEKGNLTTKLGNVIADIIFDRAKSKKSQTKKDPVPNILIGIAKHVKNIEKNSGKSTKGIAAIAKAETDENKTHDAEEFRKQSDARFKSSQKKDDKKKGGIFGALGGIGNFFMKHPMLVAGALAMLMFPGATKAFGGWMMGGVDKFAKGLTMIGKGKKVIKGVGGALVKTAAHGAKVAAHGVKSGAGIMKGLQAGAKTLGPVKAIRSVAALMKGGKGLFSAIGGVAAKSIGKTVAKGGAKALFKRIPIVGSVLSILFAINRFKKGEIRGGIIECLSGLAGLLDLIAPGVGTGVSLLLDILNVFLDSKMKKNPMDGVKQPKKQGMSIGKKVLRGLPFVGGFVRLYDSFGHFKNKKWGKGLYDLATGLGGMMDLVIPGAGTGIMLLSDIVKHFVGGKDEAEGTKKKTDAKKQKSGLGNVKTAADHAKKGNKIRAGYYGIKGAKELGDATKTEKVEPITQKAPKPTQSGTVTINGREVKVTKNSDGSITRKSNAVTTSDSGPSQNALVQQKAAEIARRHLKEGNAKGGWIRAQRELDAYLDEQNITGHNRKVARIFASTEYQRVIKTGKSSEEARKQLLEKARKEKDKKQFESKFASGGFNERFVTKPNFGRDGAGNPMVTGEAGTEAIIPLTNRPGNLLSQIGGELRNILSGKGPSGPISFDSSGKDASVHAADPRSKGMTRYLASQIAKMVKPFSGGGFIPGENTKKWVKNFAKKYSKLESIKPLYDKYNIAYNDDFTNFALLVKYAARDHFEEATGKSKWSEDANKYGDLAKMFAYDHYTSDHKSLKFADGGFFSKIKSLFSKKTNAEPVQNNTGSIYGFGKETAKGKWKRRFSDIGSAIHQGIMSVPDVLLALGGGFADGGYNIGSFNTADFKRYFNTHRSEYMPKDLAVLHSKYSKYPNFWDLAKSKEYEGGAGQIAYESGVKGFDYQKDPRYLKIVENQNRMRNEYSDYEKRYQEWDLNNKIAYKAAGSASGGGQVYPQNSITASILKRYAKENNISQVQPVQQKTPVSTSTLAKTNKTYGSDQKRSSGSIEDQVKTFAKKEGIKSGESRTYVRDNKGEWNQYYNSGKNVVTRVKAKRISKAQKAAFEARFTGAQAPTSVKTVTPVKTQQKPKYYNKLHQKINDDNQNKTLSYTLTAYIGGTQVTRRHSFSTKGKFYDPVVSTAQINVGGCTIIRRKHMSGKMSSLNSTVRLEGDDPDLWTSYDGKNDHTPQDSDPIHEKTKNVKVDKKDAKKKSKISPYEDGILRKSAKNIGSGSLDLVKSLTGYNLAKETIKGAGQGVKETYKYGVKGAGNIVNGIVGVPKEILKGTFKGVGQAGWGLLKGTGQALWGGVKGAGQALGGVGKGIGQAGWGALKGTGQVLGGVGSAIWNPLAGVGKGLWKGGVKGVGGGLVDILKGDAEKGIDRIIKGIGTACTEVVKGIGKGAWGLVKGLGKGVWSLTKGIGKGLWSAAKGITKGMWTLTKGIGKGLWTAAKGVVKGVGSVAKGVVKGAWGLVSGTAKGIWNLGKAVVALPKNIVKGVAKGAVSTVKGVWNGIKKISTGIGQAGKGIYQLATGKITWKEAWQKAKKRVTGRGGKMHHGKGVGAAASGAVSKEDKDKQLRKQLADKIRMMAKDEGFLNQHKDDITSIVRNQGLTLKERVDKINSLWDSWNKFKTGTDIAGKGDKIKKYQQLHREEAMKMYKNKKPVDMTANKVSGKSIVDGGKGRKPLTDKERAALLKRKAELEKKRFEGRFTGYGLTVDEEKELAWIILVLRDGYLTEETKKGWNLWGIARAVAITDKVLHLPPVQSGLKKAGSFIGKKAGIVGKAIANSKLGKAIAKTKVASIARVYAGGIKNVGFKKATKALVKGLSKRAAKTAPVKAVTAAAKKVASFARVYKGGVKNLGFAKATKAVAKGLYKGTIGKGISKLASTKVGGALVADGARVTRSMAKSFKNQGLIKSIGAGYKAIKRGKTVQLASQGIKSLKGMKLKGMLSAAKDSKLVKSIADSKVGKAVAENVTKFKNSAVGKKAIEYGTKAKTGLKNAATAIMKNKTLQKMGSTFKNKGAIASAKVGLKALRRTAPVKAAFRAAKDLKTVGKTAFSAFRKKGIYQGVAQGISALKGTKSFKNIGKATVAAKGAIKGAIQAAKSGKLVSTLATKATKAKNFIKGTKTFQNVATKVAKGKSIVQGSKAFKVMAAAAKDMAKVGRIAARAAKGKGIIKGTAAAAKALVSAGKHTKTVRSAMSGLKAAKNVVGKTKLVSGAVRAFKDARGIGKAVFKAVKSGKGIKNAFSIGKAALKGTKTVKNLKTGFTAAKLGVKAFAKGGLKAAAGGLMKGGLKAAGKGLMKGGLKGALKKIPIVGTIMSLIFAVQRFKKGQWGRGIIEILSGIASIFPGIGTGLSIILDLFNMFLDAKCDKEKGDVKQPPAEKKQKKIGALEKFSKAFNMAKKKWSEGSYLKAIGYGLKAINCFNPIGGLGNWLLGKMGLNEDEQEEKSTTDKAKDAAKEAEKKDVKPIAEKAKAGEKSEGKSGTASKPQTFDEKWNAAAKKSGNPNLVHSANVGEMAAKYAKEGKTVWELQEAVQKYCSDNKVPSIRTHLLEAKANLMYQKYQKNQATEIDGNKSNGDVKKDIKENQKLEATNKVFAQKKANEDLKSTVEKGTNKVANTNMVSANKISKTINTQTVIQQSEGKNPADFYTPVAGVNTSNLI